MRPVDIIAKKRDGAKLSRDEIERFVRGATDGTWPDYQIAALLMAIVCRGMDRDETAWLTDAMVHSGEKLDLSEIAGYKVDKHSTGGVGDKTSLILAPLVAACGGAVPMMSGRGLGHTGGTLDKLESIPGFRVDLGVAEMKRVLAKVGCVLIGQTREVAPADRVLYALRDVTATVESIPLITASIMSKKIAEGIQGLVLDVKCGRGAFMKNLADASALADSLVATGKANGLETSAYVTAMDSPLGRAVGNAIEVRESIATLRGDGPTDLESLSVLLAARMLRLADKSLSHEQAESKIRGALDSGSGLQKFREIIEAQGGESRVVDDPTTFLPLADGVHEILAEQDGFIANVHAEKVGLAAMVLGGGRQKVSDAIDHGVGIALQRKPGDAVVEGDLLALIYYRDPQTLQAAQDLLQDAFEFSDDPPSPAPLVIREYSD